MKKNNKKNILKKMVSFDCDFCDRKFFAKSKCYKFYTDNIMLKENKMIVCPYGYACLFGNDSVISGIIDEKICRLNLIFKRECYSKRDNQYVSQYRIMSNDEIERLKQELNLEIILNIYRDTFHYLNNNNRYLSDCYDSIPSKYKNNSIKTSKKH